MFCSIENLKHKSADRKLLILFNSSATRVVRRVEIGSAILGKQRGYQVPIILRSLLAEW